MSDSCMFRGHRCEGNDHIYSNRQDAYQPQCVFVCIASPTFLDQLMLHSPSDANVSVGEGVNFQCRLILCGESNIPSSWIIGGMSYSALNLPNGYRNTEGALRIDAVWESLNNTKFACMFIVHAGHGNLSCIKSSPACLLVYGRGRTNDSENQLPTSNPIVTAWSNTTATVNDINVTTAVSTSSTHCDSGKILTAKCETPASTETTIGEFQ